MSVARDVELRGILRRTRSMFWAAADFGLTNQGAPPLQVSGDGMRNINWRTVAFWVALWWFVYSAPTEDPFAGFRAQGIEHSEAFD